MADLQPRYRKDAADAAPEDIIETPIDMDTYRARQKQNVRLTAIILIGFCVLTFAITIVKMGMAQ
jgi:hypothetical protein